MFTTLKGCCIFDTSTEEEKTMTDEDIELMKNKIKRMTDGHLCLSIQLTRLSVDRRASRGQGPEGKLAILWIELLREAGERGLVE